MFIWALSRPLQFTNGAESVPEKNLEILFWISSEQALNKLISIRKWVPGLQCKGQERMWEWRWGCFSSSLLTWSKLLCLMVYLYIPHWYFSVLFVNITGKHFDVWKLAGLCKKEIIRRCSGYHCLTVSSNIFERMIYKILFFILGLPEGTGSVMRLAVCAN